MWLVDLIAHYISVTNRLIGKTIAWASLLLVLLVFVLAVLRYVFQIGSIPMQELVIYLHGIIFMFGASYTLADDGHVRVDVIYSKMSDANKAWVNFWGTLLFLFPVCVFILYISADYVNLSWKIKESSAEAGGLPYLYVLKSLILVLPGLLILQGIAVVLSSMVTILKSKGIHD